MTLQFFIRRAYEVRENERRHNIRARENAKRHDNASEGDNRGGSNNGAKENPQMEESDALSMALKEVKSRQSGDGRSAVSDGKEVAAPSVEGAKVGVTDGEKSAATGYVVPSVEGKTDN